MAEDNLGNTLGCGVLYNPPRRKRAYMIGTDTTKVVSCTGVEYEGRLITIKVYSEKYNLSPSQVKRRINKRQLEGQFTKCRRWLVFDRPPDDYDELM